MIADYFKISFNSLKDRKLRSLLTMIGIFIGIAAVVSLVSLGQGLQKSISEEFEMLGVDKVIISPGSSFGGIGTVGGSATQLTQDDIDTVKKVRGVKTAGGMMYKLAKVKFKDEVKYTFVIGLPTDETMKVIEALGTFKIANGRDFKSSDMYKILIGDLIASGDFFSKKVGLRDRIEIEGTEFTVIGQIAKIGNPSDDTQIYVPMDAARIILNEPKKYDTIIVQTSPGFDTQTVADNIEKKLRNARNVKKGEEDFNVQTGEGIKEAYNTIFSVVEAVVIGLASISLFVGGIGIMNTMYTAVLQRTNEIGVMKAIGAQNRDILTLFLIESGMLGLAGGAIGILIGMGISSGVSSIAKAAGWGIIQAFFPWYLIVGALAFSFVVGTVSGVLPAMQASKLKPVDALRYE
jgi:putative ABC transport system permease protein